MAWVYWLPNGVLPYCMPAHPLPFISAQLDIYIKWVAMECGLLLLFNACISDLTHCLKFACPCHPVLLQGSNVSWQAGWVVLMHTLALKHA
jgi:hypothetical protein